MYSTSFLCISIKLSMYLNQTNVFPFFFSYEVSPESDGLLMLPCFSKQTLLKTKETTMYIDKSENCQN